VKNTHTHTHTHTDGSVRSATHITAALVRKGRLRVPLSCPGATPPEPTSQIGVGDEHCYRLRARGEEDRGQHKIRGIKIGPKYPPSLSLFNKTCRRVVRSLLRSVAGVGWRYHESFRCVSPALGLGLQQRGENNRDSLISPDVRSFSTGGDPNIQGTAYPPYCRNSKTTLGCMHTFAANSGLESGHTHTPPRGATYPVPLCADLSIAASK